jgi:hypothetical protein
MSLPGNPAASVDAMIDTAANLAFVATHPVWSVLTVALDVVVIHALAVHGRETGTLRS